MKLSVAIITFNEEYILKQNLETVQDIADEIVIVDSFSTDNTPEIAKNFPKVKFIQKKFEGFGTQKNYTIDQCSSEWILFVDADEIIDETCKNHIQNIVNQSKSEYNLYRCVFDNYIFGKKLRFGDNPNKIKFFRKGHGRYTEDIVHEVIETKEPVGKLSGRIKHYSIRSISYHIGKLNLYSDKMAQLRNTNHKKSSVFKIVLSPIFRFLWIYIFRLGILDGLGGLYMAASESFYTYLKYMKLYELQNKK